jgi:hypothetical protein
MSYRQEVVTVVYCGIFKILGMLLLQIYLAVQGAYAQPDWELMIDRSGVKVYAKSLPDEKIKTIRAECVLNVGVEKIVDLILDAPAAKKWVCHTKSCILLRRVSGSEVYYYTEVSLPWPMSNRDFVTHATVSRDSLTQVVTVNAPAVPGWVLPKKGVVRVNHAVGHWVIRPVAPERTKVIYTLQVDPGGMVPAWIINSFSCQAPVETFQNMRKLLAARKNH